MQITDPCGTTWGSIRQRTTHYWAAYQDIYLAQKNRLEGMGYFDFVMSEVHGLRIMVNILVPPRKGYF